MKKILKTIMCVLVIGSVAAVLVGCDRSHEPLTDKEKALIDKAAMDKKSLTGAEQKELATLLSEKNEAEHYLGQKEHQREMRNWSKKSTAKPLKDFP